MTEALERSVMEKGIEIIDFARVIKIITDGNKVSGIAAVNTVTGETSLIACSNVILATGGPAGIYKNTVYPESQHGATGLAIDAGAALSNMDQWQYGIASTKFRWNLSGTYQQVIPRYISVDESGEEKEFLYEELGEEAYGAVFLKGYQWPFDTRKTDGSSRVDLIVAKQIKEGKRVYLDFTRNPIGLDLDRLPEEAHSYLERSGALFGTPIERLDKMNRGAIELYASHGIDLWNEPLEIAVCAQHCNGGVAVDAHWQSEVEGLYVVGEAAGTFGVYRPGGSALNSTQVGALRAAEHISKKKCVCAATPSYEVPTLSFGESNVKAILCELQSEMSRVADFARSSDGMEALLARVKELKESFFETVRTSDVSESAELFKLYDTVLTQISTLSAMLLSAKVIGTHGAAIVDGIASTEGKTRESRTVTRGELSSIEPISPMPDPELWFETLLRRQKEALDGK